MNRRDLITGGLAALLAALSPREEGAAEKIRIKAWVKRPGRPLEKARCGVVNTVYGSPCPGPMPMFRNLVLAGPSTPSGPPPHCRPLMPWDLAEEQ